MKAVKQKKIQYKILRHSLQKKTPTGVKKHFKSIKKLLIFLSHCEQTEHQPWLLWSWCSDRAGSITIAEWNHFVTVCVLYVLCLCSDRIWWWTGSSVSHLAISEWSGSHMQLATLLEPWPTSLIWLTWDEQTATPAPARQWDTEPTSSHLNKREPTIRKL